MKYLYVLLFFSSFFNLGCDQTINTTTLEKPDSVVSNIRLSTNTDVPLIAYYTRNSVNTSAVTVRVKGKTSGMDIAHTYEVGCGEKFPIFGLYPDYVNTIVITDGNFTESVFIKTPALPTNTPVNTRVINNTLEVVDPFNQDLYWIHGWISGRNDFCTIAYDKKGDVRYFQLTNEEAEPVRIAYVSDSIQIQDSRGIFTLTGEKTHSFEPTSHHDVITLPNGNFVSLASSEWGYEDRVVEQKPDGSIVRDIRFGSLFRDIVDVDSNPYRSSDVENLNKIVFDDTNKYFDTNGVQKVIDWAHVNSLVYDEESGSMYFSLRCQAVIAVNYSEWKLLWWMADESLKTRYGIGENSGVPYPDVTFHDVQALKSYQVKGVGEKNGPKNQHALFLHKNGNLSMFDNAGDEVTNTEGSRYIEYKVEGYHGNWTATVANEYRDARLYSRITSDVDFTGEGHLLILWGTELLAREIDMHSAIQDVLFELELLDPNPNFVYRIDKMPLYPYVDKEKKYSVDYSEQSGI